MIVVPVARIARSHGLSGPIIEWCLPVLVAVLACVIIVWLLRRRITLNIRQELIQRGMPTCVACGYNLTGNQTGRCSECGRKINV